MTLKCLAEGKMTDVRINYGHNFDRIQVDSDIETASPQSQAQLQEVRPDLSQRIERKLAHLNASEDILSRWFVEIVCWGTSALSMTTIIIMLYSVDNARRWSGSQLGLSIIAVLSKIAAALLTIPTSEAIGQLKWNWFYGDESKDLVDFEIFDKASRGPWGSFMLLLRTKGRSLAAFGALLTLLMLATDSVFQQMIHVPTRMLEGRIGKLPKIVRYEPRFNTVLRDGSILQSVDEDLRTVTDKFFFDNGTSPMVFGKGVRADIPVTCGTNNCTWEPYETLAVCSACEDISHLLEFACLSLQFDWTSDLAGVGTPNSTWPNGTMCGHFINVTSNPVLMTGYNSNASTSNAEEALIMRTLPLITNPDRNMLYDGSINFKNIRTTIVDFLVSSSQDGSAESVYRNETPVAHECILYWCVRSLTSSLSGGSYLEEVLETYTNSNSSSRPSPWLTAHHNGTKVHYMEDININAPNGPNRSDYGLSNDTHITIAHAFDSFLPSFTTVKGGSSERWMRFDAHSTTNNVRLPFSNPWLQPNNISSHVARLAFAMSNSIRRSSASNATSDYYGKSISSEMYISVQWGWIAFPLTMLVGSLWFLLATIRLSANEKEAGIWKTSTMPTLIYSLPKDVQKKLSSDGTSWADTVKRNAGKTKVNLVPKMGWRVSGYISAPTTPIIRRNSSPGWI